MTDTDIVVKAALHANGCRHSAKMFEALAAEIVRLRLEIEQAEQQIDYGQHTAAHDILKRSMAKSKGEA